MKPWQEDNVPFFKVAHINEQAGYMGRGILGEGPYRHTITPYYFIYKVFGYNIPVFYALMLLSYIFASISIYLLARNMLGEKGGRIASFIFGCGYVASEGFHRVYTSTNISSGIGFVALLLLTYWTYYKSKNIKWFILTVFMYWVTIQVSYVRVHYLLIPLLVFDILYLTHSKLSNIKWFLFRSIPFLLIFNEYYIVQGDSRKSGILQVVKAILAGKFENTHSFLGSFGNLVIPDFIQSSPVAVGIGMLIICMFLLIRFKKENKKVFILFLSIIFANIAAYAAYTPEVIYATNYRYLAHSFFAFSVILGLFSLSKNKIITYLIIILGVVLLFFNVRQQWNILKERTEKITRFYRALKNELPDIPKDSVIYFDIQDTEYAKQMYKVSFSVAEMPETTAIAWRYGIDRYDFKMPSTYSEFTEIIKVDKTPIDKIFTFWISDQGLINTTEATRKYLNKQNYIEIICNDKIIRNGEVRCLNNINSINPIEINLELSATPSLKDHQNINIDNVIYHDQELIDKAFDYKLVKDNLLSRSVYTSSSFWKDRVIGNINDQDINTVWQSDRVSWGQEDTNFIVKLPYPLKVGQLYWIPGHKNNIPIEYIIEGSADQINWEKLNNSFVKYIRMRIVKTSGGDSPQIAESWIIPTQYMDMDIEKVEYFLKNPFAIVENTENYNKLVDKLGKKGEVRLYWKGNESNKWISEFETKANVIYDGKIRKYKLVIPPGGTVIDAFKLEGTIPGEITVYRLFAKPAKVGTL